MLIPKIDPLDDRTDGRSDDSRLGGGAIGRVGGWTIERTDGATAMRRTAIGSQQLPAKCHAIGRTGVPPCSLLEMPKYAPIGELAGGQFA